MHHLVQFSDLTLVVRGPAGIGKTTFLRELLGGAGDRWRVCLITADAQTTPRRLLEAALGKSVRLITTHPQTGLETIREENDAPVVARWRSSPLTEIESSSASGSSISSAVTSQGPRTE